MEMAVVTGLKDLSPAVSDRQDTEAVARTRPEPQAGVSLTAALEFRPWLEAIAQISAAVNNMEPLPNVLNATAALTCRLLGYDFGAVLLPDQDRLYIRGSHGLAQSYVTAINSEKPIRLGYGEFAEGPSSRAFRSHMAVVIRDYREDLSVGPWAGVAVEQDYRSLAAIPLIVVGRAIGVLNCYTRDVHDFSRDELLLLTTVANQAALAIETGRLRSQERATITRLQAVKRSLEKQTHMLEVSERIHVELMSAVLNDRGLPAIAQALSGILRASVVILDTASGPLTSAAFGSTPTAVPSQILKDPRFAAQLAQAVEARSPIELTPEDWPALENSAFVAPIIIGRDVVAQLWVLGSEASLQALERRALDHGSTVVALELLKQRIASEVEDRLAGELLDDLLGDRAVDEQIARARANHLGHDLSAKHIAIVAGIDPVPHDSTPLELKAARNRQLRSLIGLLLRRRHFDALLGEREGVVIVMLADRGRGPSDAQELADLIRRDVHAYMTGVSVSTAIGTWVDETSELTRSYRIARGALDLAQRSGRTDLAVNTEKLGVHGLLLSVDRLDELVRFAANTLNPLRAYDAKRSGELVETLIAYLAHGCRPGETAHALVVHPNTVAYRIRRIETLLDIDLGRPDAQLQMQFALTIDDIVNVGASDSIVK
jgi:sugar diacid utilization regulator